MSSITRENMKYRLAGFMVIIALFAIFLPLLFNQNKSVLEELKIARFVPPVPPQPFNVKPGEEFISFSKLPTLQDRNTSQPSQSLSVSNPSPINQEKSQASSDLQSRSVPIVSEDVPEPSLQPPLTMTTESTFAELNKTGWTVQLASFSSEENASKLVQQLQNQGFPAYTATATNLQGKLVNRVLVGPEAKREEADILLPELERSTSLKGIVIKHDPLQG
ncbi:MAG: SPOR domain-containing protein [Gammaproteobacteria bacterium]